jgi:hypothetical protein
VIENKTWGAIAPKEERSDLFWCIALSSLKRRGSRKVLSAKRESAREASHWKRAKQICATFETKIHDG